jgi:hypothetical protein
MLVTFGAGAARAVGFSSAPIAKDPYFSYVSMLLHCDGTNGAQNNTFTDSSNNAITRNGNTTQGSFSPYGSNWSNYFDGSSSYLNFGNQTALHLGSGDFTVETWIIKNANNLYMTVCGDFASASTNTFQITLLDSGGPKIGWYNGATNSFTITSVATIPMATWTHIAFVRSGTTLSLYINGSLDSSASLTTNYNASTSLYVAHTPELAAGRYWNGYISNFRVVKGTAVYTSAFTPSTTPLTAIPGTSLLTCQSNRFIDNSSNNFAITVNGTPSVQRFSPFSPTAAYSTSVIGGSGYFDGSGDYLDASASAGLGGSGNFTLQAWLYPTTVAGDCCFYETRGGSGWVFFINSSGYLQVYDSSATAQTASTTQLKANQWTHIALVKNGSTCTYYVNGATAGTFTLGTFQSATRTRVGSRNDAAQSYFGWIADLRTDTTALTITVPTAPLTAAANTNYLLNFTNGGISDNAMINNLETVGNAQISTSVFKYGTGSMYFPVGGGSSYLVIPNNPSITLQEGNWTMESWIYPTNTFSVRTIAAKGFGVAGGFLWWVQSGDLRIRLYDAVGAQVNIIAASVIVQSEWSHVAAVRNGNTVTLYLNGASVASGSFTSSLTASNNLEIGIYNGTTGAFLGYIDDLRITKGYARYTANFTPPTAAFADTA